MNAKKTVRRPARSVFWIAGIAVATEYGGITGIPTTFIIDGRGMIVAKFEGYRPRAVFEDALARLLR